MAQPSIGSSPDNQGKRQLNITDALNYINAVKKEFKDRPDVYNVFLKTMEDFKEHSIDTPGVISRISTLFRSHPALIPGFNAFLPVGYRIDAGSESPSDDLVTVTTPKGTMRQPLSVPSGEDGSAEPRENSGDLARPPGLEPAIDYLQLFKTRFGPDTYKRFLEILSSHRSSTNEEVVVRVDELFNDAPDVAAAFREFLAASEGDVVTTPPEPTSEGEKSVVDGLANLSLNT
ncbi:hypothetical protein EVG20_g7408 [Dentipellis fragilis]|uniref:Histone deacetylase interacting domain-containing protein n=1 Tax=Dentipellis fragilis TaxID=205917 RepID=A0A4Y9YD53_9AGAM|nr:hypothetical protein EVG20_g7408 [Dentipellis fragilis]